ncbi:hypothetical protein [Amycolatopsis sp. RTGN1]|uniref:hypothetical protein n=1 Tax=Amycolatopsis ponsaeliensis TaxID=2992142 RepID=UPI00254E3D15|nr:hypothetical protein [Amycolatopsis sp. RTGN1]
MNVWFGSRELARTCGSDRARVSAYGKESARLIRVRLGQLRGVVNLAKMREFAAVRLRSGVIAQRTVVFISAGHKVELVVQGADDSVKLADEATVTSVIVVGVLPVGLKRPGQHSDASSLEYKGSL